jgi:hypothetical protein
VVHTYKTSYLGGWDLEDQGLKPAQANSRRDPIPKITKMDCWCGSRGRTPALQVRSPEFKPKTPSPTNQPINKQMNKYIHTYVCIHLYIYIDTLTCMYLCIWNLLWFEHVLNVFPKGSCVEMSHLLCVFRAWKLNPTVGSWVGVSGDD